MQAATKPDGIYAAFLEDLASGVIRPGQRVGEKSLARRWNVSRVPIREMLIRLEAEGFVDREVSTGTFVRQIDVEEYEELFELRVAIESVMMRRAARLATDRELDQLVRLAKITDRIANSPDKVGVIRAEHRFHMQLCEVSGMRHAGRILRLEQFLVHTFRATAFLPLDPGAPSDVHMQLVKALRTRNPDHAEAVLREQYAIDLVRVRQRIESAALPPRPRNGTRNGTRPRPVKRTPEPSPRIWQR